MSPFETTAAECAADAAADEQQRREDRRLLARTLKWARDNGRVRDRRYEGGRFAVYVWTCPDGRVWLGPSGDVTVYVGFHSLQPETVREAVDLLVALGVLPVEMSSAYEAGRESAYVPDVVEWSTRWPYGGVDLCWDESEARARHGRYPRESVLVQRRVGPWTEVAG